MNLAYFNPSHKPMFIQFCIKEFIDLKGVDYDLEIFLRMIDYLKDCHINYDSVNKEFNVSADDWEYIGTFIDGRDFVELYLKDLDDFIDLDEVYLIE